jgi:hypothetical protein
MTRPRRQRRLLRSIGGQLRAGWSVLLGPGLAFSGAGPAGQLASRLVVLLLLASFAVVNSVLRGAAQWRLS